MLGVVLDQVGGFVQDLDVTMPIMDGLETARRLHAMNPNVRIVMLSAMR